MDAATVLKTRFGHAHFRGRQEAMIERVMAGGHSLVIMPTGMGKSLCYQVPALLLAPHENASAPPLTLVISPLIALMKDQVDALRQRGIDATFINSSLDRRERESRYASVRAGRHVMLYVTPERFRKTEFLEAIQRRDVRLLAVDEAHCISEWGHDFRPDYTRLGDIRALLGNPVTMALTATATPDVQDDIVRQLGLAPSDVRTFHEGIDRPNLSLEVEPTWDDDEKLDEILAVRRQQPGSGIVYFALIKSLSAFSERLRERGVAHLIYHGELPRQQRKQLQDRFMGEADHLVLATNAFGMGIDKEDIRFVMHADVPGSLESYYQEIGRAGRDGAPSRCRLLYDERDLATQMEFLDWSNPDASFYVRLYQLLVHHAEQLGAFGLEWLRDQLLFKDRHDRRLETALAMLERYGVIEGSLAPLDVRVAGELPSALSDDARLEAKRRRDQQKLYTMVQYVRWEGDRKAFIHEYFGLPYPSSAG